MDEHKPDSDAVVDEIPVDGIPKPTEETEAQSGWQRFSANPLTLLIAGFILTGFIGNHLTESYNSAQKALEAKRFEDQRDLEYLRAWDMKDLEFRRAKQQKDLEFLRAGEQRRAEQVRSLTLELSKTRVEKVAEVMEKAYAYEDLIDVIDGRYKNFEDLQRDMRKRGQEIYNRIIEGNYKNFAEMERDYAKTGKPLRFGDSKPVLPKLLQLLDNLDKVLKQEQDSYSGLVSLLHRDRFWLGEEVYAEVESYIGELRTYPNGMRKAVRTYETSFGLNRDAKATGSGSPKTEEEATKQTLTMLSELHEALTNKDLTAAYEELRRKKPRLGYKTIRDKLLEQ